MKEIKRLNINKASQSPIIPITIIHENMNIFADFLAESLKGKIKTYSFPNCLKRAGFTPLHRKRENRQQGRVWTGQYSANVIQNIEKNTFEQISVYFDKFSSDEQFGFRK